MEDEPVFKERRREDEAQVDLRIANEKLLLAGVREQRAAEQAIDAARQLTALIETMSEGVSVFNGQGELVMVNSVGRSLLRCFPPGLASLADYRACDLRRLDRTPFDFEREVVPRLLRGEQFCEEEVLIFSPEGEERHLVLSGNSVRGADGEVTLAINVYRDITQVRLLEQVRAQYVSLISHDLRGPLSAAKMAAQLIERDQVDENRKRSYAGRIVMNLDRMDRMVRNLLDAQRITAGHTLPLVLGPCDLVAIAREVIEDLATLHGDRCVLRSAESLPGIWSADQVARALWNLITNAFKYGPPGEAVDIAVFQRDDRAVISVHNGGAPIPPEDLLLLFAPFARSRTAISSGLKGWGLGLTLVRGCAEAHGGKVSVTSDAESGTRFTLELPIDSTSFAPARDTAPPSVPPGR